MILTEELKQNFILHQEVVREAAQTTLTLAKAEGSDKQSILSGLMEARGKEHTLAFEHKEDKMESRRHLLLFMKYDHLIEAFCNLDNPNYTNYI